MVTPYFGVKLPQTPTTLTMCEMLYEIGSWWEIEAAGNVEWEMDMDLATRVWWLFFFLARIDHETDTHDEDDDDIATMLCRLTTGKKHNHDASRRSVAAIVLFTTSWKY